MTKTDTSRERIERLRSIDCADYLHMTLLDRAEKAEAERDTAWNDAIEAAAQEADNLYAIGDVGNPGNFIRDLKKGDTP